MEALQGAHIKQLDFIPFKLGDLIYHEGPLLSHFRDDNNKDTHYLYKWSDCDESVNRWMIFKTTPYTLIDFLNRKITLKQAINNQPFVYFVDFENELIIRDIVLVGVEALPESYLPSEDSLYDDEEYEEYAKSLRVNLMRQFIKFEQTEPYGVRVAGNVHTWNPLPKSINACVESEKFSSRIPTDLHRYTWFTRQSQGFLYNSGHLYHHHAINSYIDMSNISSAINIPVYFNGKWIRFLYDPAHGFTIEEVVSSLEQLLQGNTTY